MENTKFEALKVGDKVRIIKSGKVQQVTQECAGPTSQTRFRSVMADGSLRGPSRLLKSEEIETVSK